MKGEVFFNSLLLREVYLDLDAMLALYSQWGYPSVVDAKIISSVPCQFFVPTSVKRRETREHT